MIPKPDVSKIEKLALTDPIVAGFFHHYRRGSIDYVEALQWMVVALSEAKKDVENERIRHMERCSLPIITNRD